MSSSPIAAARHGVDELAFYRRICEVASAHDADALLARALEAAVELSGSDGGHLVLAEPGDAGELPILLTRGAAPAMSQSIVRRALETARPIRIENALDDPAYRRLSSVLSLNILSVLVVPIAHDGAVLAALHLVNTRLAGVYGPATEQVVASFATRIAPALHAWVEARRLVRARDELQARLEGLTGSVGLVGTSPAFLALVEQVARVAPTDVPVLILGESGTGKEELARTVHRQSGRRDGPWVAVNCGAIPEALLESELFGHEKGAFTGAARRAGKFSSAHRGTIFLDEVGELSPTCQVGLLRALQSGEVQRVGSDALIEVDVRVVAATNRPLRRLVAEGKFREDLFYRLGVVTLEVPPLRERGDDVLLLAEHLARRHAVALGCPHRSLSPEARAALLRHAFPGNVRELENVLRRALIFARGDAIGVEDLPPELRAEARPREAALPLPAAPTTRIELIAAKQAATAAVERAFVEHALTSGRGNVAEAARLVEMNRTSLHELIRRHGIDTERFQVERP